MSKINIISISDIHIGHTKTRPEVIQTNLRKYLYCNLTDDIDILIISGDFFDTLLDMNGDAGFIAAQTISEIKELCLNHKIYLRVLRGTFTHDRHQNQFFTVDTDVPRIGKDLSVRVFNNISIEWIEELGVSILYVPDDLAHENPLSAIKQCVLDSPYDKVDIASMHCYFDHLLPRGIPRKPHNCYSPDDIIPLVYGPILNGHIHNSCVHKTIFTNGSFDRLNHSEEEDKGYFKIQYDTSDHKVSYDFITNRGAVLYKSVIVGHDSMTLDEFPTWVNKIIDSNISPSKVCYVRVISDDRNIREAAHKYVTSTFDNVYYSCKKFTTKDDESIKEHPPTVEELPTITEDTLPSMVVEYVKDKHNVILTEKQVMSEFKIP